MSLPRALLCALLALSLATPLRAQETPPRIDLDPGAQQQEILELFAKVERRLKEIDRLLSDAAAGQGPGIGRAAPSGIDELLKRTRRNGEEVKAGIDRIIELAQQMQPSSSSGSGQREQPGEGGSPLDRQGEQSTGREQTPRGREPQPGSDGKPQPGQDQPQPSPQQTPADGQPRDPGTADLPPHERPAQPPPAGATGAAGAAGADRERWGDLPVQARDVFRSEGGSAMPARYRDWIDAYHRRLNQRP